MVVNHEIKETLPDGNIVDGNGNVLPGYRGDINGPRSADGSLIKDDDPTTFEPDDDYMDTIDPTEQAKQVGRAAARAEMDKTIPAHIQELHKSEPASDDNRSPYRTAPQETEDDPPPTATNPKPPSERARRASTAAQIAARDHVRKARKDRWG